MKVVVLAGPESAGKSRLAEALHRRFGGVRVDEYVRRYYSQLGRETTLADITPIAQGQLAEEDAARALHPRLLILDTHLLSNRLWSLVLFDQCPAWIEPALLARHYDLTLLLSPEGMPWVDDGQRCQPALADRAAFHAASRQWLVEHRQCFIELGGSWPEREAAAFEYVSKLLGA